MRPRTIIVICAVLAAVLLVWTLRLQEPAVTDERSTTAVIAETPAPAPEPNQLGTASDSLSNDDPIDAADRARFNEQAREFFAQAPALPTDEARRRAEALAKELSRIERAGGMSAGETFLLRAGLIRATEPDEQRQAAQLRALKERYEAETRQRSGQPDSDPMFELYKVRESQIVAEVMAMQTIPDGLSRDEYLRRRLQEAREQLLAETL
jgi:hypothetical protein